MKLARNLALALLVLLYGGCYWLFYRDEVLAPYTVGGSDSDDYSGLDKALQQFFAPAAEIHLRMTADRLTRKVLVGQLVGEKPGDFVTLAEDGSCRFQLGEFTYSGTLNYHRAITVYSGSFTHKGEFYGFYLGINASKRASAVIRDYGPPRREIFFPLTRSPAPTP